MQFRKFSDKRKILPAEKVRRTGENDKEYNVRQKKMMSDSQFNAITVAFDKAGLPVEIDFDGVFVMSVLEDGAADGILEVGDKIYKIDGVQLEQSGQFYTFIGDKKLGDKVLMSLERNEEMIEVSVTLKEIPGENGRVGLGVRFSRGSNVNDRSESGVQYVQYRWTFGRAYCSHLK